MMTSKDLSVVGRYELDEVVVVVVYDVAGCCCLQISPPKKNQI